MKPPGGTPIDRTDPLAAGLACALAFADNGGPAAWDATGNGNAGVLGPSASWGSGPRGPVLVLPGNASSYVSCGNNPSLQFGTGPFSAFLRAAFPTPSAAWFLFGYGGSGANPQWWLRYNAANQLEFRVTSTNGNNGNVATIPAIQANAHHSHVLTRDAAGSCTLYFDGVAVATAGGVVGSVSYPTNGLVLGARQDRQNGSPCVLDCFCAANRCWSPAEVAALHADPYRPYRPARARAYAVAGIAPGFANVSPGTVYANGTTLLTLVGLQTNWVGGTTTFSVSGVAGASVVGQSITAATHATVTVQAGSAAGPAVLSDGGHTTGIRVAPDSFTAAPAGIPSNHPGNLTLALTGLGTNWTAGTAFTVSGVAGVAKVSQSVASATSATLVVTTGSGAGTLTISDGALTATASVAAAALSMTPTQGAATGTYPVTFQGLNTAWTQGVSFATSGVAGAAISGLQVQSDTHATATLTLSGTGGGPLVVADTSTGATATMAVQAVPSGSLHVAAPLLLQHTGGSPGMFGNQANAGLAFRFLASSNAGLNSDAGTTILDFGNTPSGLPVAYYDPATQQLIFRVYDNDGGRHLSATVPIQLGVAYDFLLSWAVGSQVLYVNGQPHTASAIASGTYPYGGLLIGGNAGTNLAGNPQATDHAIADVAIWSGYAPTATDALNRAVGTKTALSVATAASAWWPFGGGPLGTNPVAGDLSQAWGWLNDYTGNGNTLSVATTTPAGSLAAAAYAAAIPIGNPLSVRAVVSKWGLLTFIAEGAAPINGAKPVAVVTAVNAVPTAKRNGTPVALGPPIWFPHGLDGDPLAPRPDSPCVHYQPLCGGVQAVAIKDGGEGYASAPTVTAPGGFTAGTPVMATGVTSYTMTNRGSGYNQPPKLVINDPGGGSGAKGYVEIVWANGLADGASPVAVVGGVKFTAGGSGYSAQTTLTLDYTGVSGSGATLSPIVAGGVLVGANVLNHGSGHGSPPAAVVDFPPNESGPNANIAAGQYVDVNETMHSLVRANVYGADAALWGGTPGTIRELVPLVGGLLGCGSGYNPVAPPNVSISGGGGSGATATAVVSQYISYVPVTAPGDFTSPPALAVSGGSPTRPAVLRPMMAGFKPADVVTYSAPASWIAATIGGNPVGGLQAAADAAVTNSVGADEPDFSAPKTMVAGVNSGFQPAYRYNGTQTYKNKLHDAAYLAKVYGSGVVTSAADGTPVSWTSPADTVIGTTFYGPDTGNFIDNMSTPALYGPWTLQYDDPNVNTANAAAVWLTSKNNIFDQVITPVMLSGPASPITIPAGNITVNGSGAITAISLSGLALGTGWQGAAIQVLNANGSGSSGASATVTVSGGVPTAVTVVTPGSFQATPTVVLYGTAVSGHQVTHVFDFEYVPTTTPGTGPSQWCPTVAIHASQPQGTWTVGNPWAVAPDVRTRTAAAAIDRTRPLAMDDAVLAMLTGPSGLGPGPMRWMSAIHGGVFNCVVPSDIFSGTNLFWQSSVPATTLSIASVRCYNTDPAKGPAPAGDGTYGWVSPNVYGPQALFAQGPDAFGKYVQLAPTDNGKWIFNRADFAVFELKTAAPHGISSGYWAQINGDTLVPLTDAASWWPGHGYVSVRIWVTGPNTLAFAYGVGGGGHSTGTQRVNSTAEVPVNWTVTIVPGDTSSNVPLRYAVAATAQAGADFWWNAPIEASDATIAQLVANEIAPFIGTRNLYIEVDNEVWNGTRMVTFAHATDSLLNALPAGTPVLGYTTEAGSRPKSFGLISAHIHDVARAAWTAAGLPASRLHAIASGWGGNYGFGQDNLDGYQRTGRAADHLCIAMYTTPPADPPYMQAIAPAGSAWADAGSLPVAQVNDLARYHIFYAASWRSTGSTQGSWAPHAPVVRNFGQPNYQLYVATDTPGSTGLSPANYTFYYTFADGQGRETTVGMSQSVHFGLASGSAPWIAVPAMPPWAAAINIYVGKNCAPGVCTFYQQITRAQYNTTNPPGSKFTLAAAIPAGYTPPPTTNNAAPNIAGTPSLVLYEYATQNIVPSWHPLVYHYMHDAWAHPSSADLYSGLNRAAQQGDPTTPGSGMAMGCYFEAFQFPQYPSTWFLMNGVAQLPGDGYGHAYAGSSAYAVAPNRFATIAGGVLPGGQPPDGHDHMQANTSPMFQALRAWMEAPVRPITPAVRTRRWFAGLGRPNARLGR
jgi:hypothetical protein